MHKHPIDFELPFNLGRIKAQIDHRPLDSENILIIVEIETLPKMFRAIAPKKMVSEPFERVLKRSLVRLWGANFTTWADEPVPEGGSHE